MLFSMFCYTFLLNHIISEKSSSIKQSNILICSLAFLCFSCLSVIALVSWRLLLKVRESGSTTAVHGPGYKRVPPNPRVTLLWCGSLSSAIVVVHESSQVRLTVILYTHIFNVRAYVSQFKTPTPAAFFKTKFSMVSFLLLLMNAVHGAFIPFSPPFLSASVFLNLSIYLFPQVLLLITH